MCAYMSPLYIVQTFYTVFGIIMSWSLSDDNKVREQYFIHKLCEIMVKLVCDL